MKRLSRLGRLCRRALPPSGRAGDVALELFLRVSSVLSTVALLAIFGFLAYFSAPLWSRAGLADLLSTEWRPFHGNHGILPMICTSVVIASVAVLLAFPIALGTCCFARGLGPRVLARATIGLVHLMTSIPTIVYAFAAATVLPPILRDVFHSGSGYSLLTAVAVLAVLILPTIVLVIHGAWHGRAEAVCLTGASLGLTRAQSLFRLLVPVSKPALSMAAILGFGRAIGDTMIALLLAGNAPQMPVSPLEAVRALTAHIALVVATDAHSSAYHSVFACGVILLCTTAAVSVGARVMRRLADRGGAQDAMGG